MKHTVGINTDFPDRKNNSTHLIIKALKKVGVFTEEEPDVVLNIDSIHNVGFKKGKKLSIYWEMDTFMTLGGNTQYYNQADINYIVTKKYLPYYPKGTKFLPVACDPEVHKEDKNVSKAFDYVFVGSIELLQTYENRIRVLDKLLRSDERLAVMYGAKQDYVKNNSMGKVILNILPRLGNSVCTNTRNYEAMAMGCLMVDYDDTLEEIGEENVHYLSLEKFGKVNDEEINFIKQNSRKHVLANHTWDHRVRQILEDIDEQV